MANESGCYEKITQAMPTAKAKAEYLARLLDDLQEQIIVLRERNKLGRDLEAGDAKMIDLLNKQVDLITPPAPPETMI
jgi:hypothetical protein